MARPLLEVSGVREFRRNLRELGEDMGENLKPAFLRAASIVAMEARGRVPVRTGALRDTIGPGATKRGAIVRAGFRSIPYAGPINYGTPEGRTKRPINIKGTHFVNDAATATEPVWSAVIFAALQEQVDLLARGVHP